MKRILTNLKVFLTLMLLCGVSSVWAGNVFELVTNANQLKSGSKYIIASAEDKGKVSVMQAYASGNNCKALAGIAVADGKITATSGMGIFTLGGKADEWTLNDGTYYLYAAGGTSTKNNYLKGEAELSSNADFWKITIAADGAATITTIDGTVKKNTLQYNPNNGSPLFSCYSATQESVYLYIETSGTGKETFKVNIETVEGGTAKASPAEAEAGTDIVLTATPDAGYQFTSWDVKAGTTPVTVTDNKFSMPASDVNVKATFTAIPTHTIVINGSAFGSITSNPEASAYEGQTVTINAVANDGYAFSKWTVTGATVVNETSSSTTFVMGEENVTVSATFEESAATTYDFTSIYDFSQWTSTYMAHTEEYSAANVTFEKANKQQNTITDCPVTKGQPVVVSLKYGQTFKSIKFECKQWAAKKQTLTLKYHNAEGEWTDLGVSSDNFAISCDEIPAGVSEIMLKFSSADNQVGIKSVTFETNKSTKSFDVTFPASGWATLYLDFAATIPSGVKAYILDSYDEDVAHLALYDQPALPEKTAVLLQGSDTKTFTETEGGLGGVKNLFKGQSMGSLIDESSVYVLNAAGSIEDIPMFSLYTGTILHGNKAYLDLPAAGANLTFVFDNATAIKTVGETKASTLRVNLAGQVVGKDYKGVVIENGKKFLNK